jgi:hypothetical protein
MRPSRRMDCDTDLRFRVLDLCERNPPHHAGTTALVIRSPKPLACIGIDIDPQANLELIEII